MYPNFTLEVWNPYKWLIINESLKLEFYQMFPFLENKQAKNDRVEYTVTQKYAF